LVEVHVVVTLFPIVMVDGVAATVQVGAGLGGVTGFSFTVIVTVPSISAGAFVHTAPGGAVH
jgi:hypothetical protein